MRHIPETLIDDDELTSAPTYLPAAPFGDIPGVDLDGLPMRLGLVVHSLPYFLCDRRAGCAGSGDGELLRPDVARIARCLGSADCSPERRWSGMIQTHTGSIPVAAAATQILLIPAASVIGLAGLIILAL